MSLKVIGAGFGRTGTMSLKIALEQLGFAKCYHMIDVITVHPQHMQHWMDAAQGRAVDWEQVFQGYQATVDWPGCNFYRELMQHYPDAKVILNVRDAEKWYESVRNTIYTLRWAPRNRLRWMLPSQRGLRRLIDTLIWDGSLQGKFQDKSATVELFKQWNDEVRSSVPAERLLEWDVTQGWEPLCRFLEVPVPEGQPFPRVNDTNSFNQRFSNQNLALGRTAFGVAATTAVLILWRLLSRNQHER